MGDPELETSVCGLVVGAKDWRTRTETLKADKSGYSVLFLATMSCLDKWLYGMLKILRHCAVG